MPLRCCSFWCIVSHHAPLSLSSCTFLSFGTPVTLYLQLSLPKTVSPGMVLPDSGSGRSTLISLLQQRWALPHQVPCSKSKSASFISQFSLLPCVFGSALIKYSSTTQGPNGAPAPRRTRRLSLWPLKDTFLFNLKLFFDLRPLPVSAGGATLFGPDLS